MKRNMKTLRQTHTSHKNQKYVDIKGNDVPESFMDDTGISLLILIIIHH